MHIWHMIKSRYNTDRAEREEYGSALGKKSFFTDQKCLNCFCFVLQRRRFEREKSGRQPPRREKEGQSLNRFLDGMVVVNMSLVDRPTQLICISDIYLLSWHWQPLWSGRLLYQWPVRPKKAS